MILYSCSDDSGLVGTRYVDDLFGEVDEIFDVKYGENAGLIGTTRDLTLTVFQPQGDVETSRPALVLAHGGAFVSGTKLSIRELCEAYAKKGYVAITIDYRLINDPSVNDSVAFSEGVVLTLGDMKAAIRFIRNDAQTVNTYGIDPDMIFAGGVSAGAVMANHVGFMDETDDIPDYLLEHINTHGGFEGNSNDIDVSSEVSGVISFSGSLFREDWIDSNDPPVFFVHEELDPIVPCGYEASDVFPFAILAHGACNLHDKAQDIGIESEFIFFDGLDTHVEYLQDENAESVINSSAEFLASIIAN